MHSRELRALGEKNHRLDALEAWRETPYYTHRERAALAWTEAITLINKGHAPDNVYEEVRPHFTQKELADLTFAIATMNAWNRLSISARLLPSGYQTAERS
jgi:alkylhydroperoxidase family enzyme